MNIIPIFAIFALNKSINPIDITESELPNLINLLRHEGERINK